MPTYFAIGIAVRPLLPSVYFLWLTRKSALFINDDGDPFLIKELPRDFETNTAFEVTTIFTSKQTVWLASNDQTFYFNYTTYSFFILLLPKRQNGFCEILLFISTGIPTNIDDHFYVVQSHLRCKYFRNQIDDDQKTLVLPNYSNGYETALHDSKYESTRKRLRYVN